MSMNRCFSCCLKIFRGVSFRHKKPSFSLSPFFTSVLPVASVDFFTPRANIRGMKQKKSGTMRAMCLSISYYVDLLILRMLQWM